MKLSKEEYKEAKGCLKRYNYNQIKLMNIRDDIMSLCAVDVDGMPKAPYSTSDRVLDSVIKLQEDSNIKEASKEIKIVNQAIELISKNAKYIFKHQYQLGQDKWDIINEGMSEGTYKRRHSELVYAVHKEIKKVSLKWDKNETFLSKKRVIIVSWIDR